MVEPGKHAVTGAFGYSGKYIARRLIDSGLPTLTLTNSPDRPHPFGDRIEIRPLAFDRIEALTESLRGVRVLYNTYWVRFNHRTFTYRTAEQNTYRLFEAAVKAGVERIVHVSITNPSEDSPYEYFAAKARMEKALAASGTSYAILRPAVLFGREDILVNNIAWAVRKLPVIGVFGRGDYRLQPIHVDDLADLAVSQGRSRTNVTLDAIGPETFTYRDLVQTIGGILGRPRPVIGVPPWLGYLTGRLLGWIVGDVMITRDEINGLMDGLLCTDSPPAGKIRLTEWAEAHRAELGIRYAGELTRRLDRKRAYAEK